MKKRIVMFQGDSITDCGRNRSDNHYLAGYSQLVKDALDKDFEFLNFACSGDTSKQALDRHVDEVKRIKPDILVLLIGVNDVWRNVDHTPDATTSEEFIDNTIKIIESTKQANPEVKIIYIEPYLLPGESMVYERGYDLYKKNIGLIRDVIPPMVDEYIVLQDFFMKNTNENMVFLSDGVHPNEKGHRVIADSVIESLKNL